MSQGKGKKSTKELLKRWNVEDSLVKTDGDLVNACKETARCMLFTIHMINSRNKGEAGKDKVGEVEAGKIQIETEKDKGEEDGIFVLAEADTDAVIQVFGGCTFVIPKNEDKKSFILHDYIDNLDLRVYVIHKDETLMDLIKDVKDADSVTGLVVRYVKNDLAVSPIYIETVNICYDRIEEIKNTMFEGKRNLTDEELEFIVNDVVDLVGLKIYEKLNNMFIFTEDHKNEMIKKRVDRMRKDILLSTLVDSNNSGSQVDKKNRKSRYNAAM